MSKINKLDSRVEETELELWTIEKFSLRLDYLFDKLLKLLNWNADKKTGYHIIFK